MFFSLSQIEDTRFPHHFHFKNFILNTDEGWHQIDNKVLKGYTDQYFTIPENIEDQELIGNFCLFEFLDGSVKLKTNKWRGFPIWADEHEITNLTPLKKQYWADDSITIHSDLTITAHKFNFLDFQNTHELTRDELIIEVHNILKNKIHNFLKIEKNIPLKVFCSGGIDSTLVFSYIRSANIEYKLVLENTVEWDYFWCKNSGTIKNNFWGYNQIHHWREPCLLTSGAPGDEFMLRSPTTGNLWLMYHGIDIFDLLRNKEYLHSEYFKKDKHIKLFEEQQKNSDDIMKLDRESFLKYIVNILINDCQHWNLGNTLTYTPLRDLEILKLFLRLKPEDGVNQLMDSSISRELINKNDSSLTQLISKKKNFGNILENLVTLL